MGRTKDLFLQEQEYLAQNFTTQTPKEQYGMNNLNNVWDHLMTQQITGKCSTTYSEFYIVNGYKIEKMNDGDVVIYNVRGTSDFYKKIGLREELTFVRNGFLKGTHILSIDYLEMKLDDLNDSIRYYMDTGRDDLLKKCKVRRKNIINKIHNHYSKIK